MVSARLVGVFGEAGEDDEAILIQMTIHPLLSLKPRVLAIVLLPQGCLVVTPRMTKRKNVHTVIQ